MTLHATLLIGVHPDKFRARFKAAPVVVAPGREALEGADGTPFAIAGLDDAVTVWTGSPFDMEPEALGKMAVSLLGSALAEHTDERGLFVLPDVARPRSTSYDGVLEEVGELGMWIALPGRVKRSGAAATVALEDKLAALGASVPPETAARMQEMLLSASPETLEAARHQIEAMAAEPGGFDSMGEQLAAMMGGGSSGDMAEMLRQAQAQLSQMQQEDPEGFAALEQQAMQMLAGMSGPKK